MDTGKNIKLAQYNIKAVFKVSGDENRKMFVVQMWLGFVVDHASKDGNSSCMDILDPRSYNSTNTINTDSEASLDPQCPCKILLHIFVAEN